MVSDSSTRTYGAINFDGISGMRHSGFKTQGRFSYVSALRCCIAVICAVVCLSVMVGCASNTAKRPANNTKVFIGNIPFIVQKADYCGPASLAMIFNFYGLNVSQDEIASEIFSPELKGTFSLEMLSYALKKGFDADVYGGSMADLRAKLEAGFPLIVSHKAEKDDKRVHYIVVFGFDDGKEVFYGHLDTKNGQAQAIDYRRFLKHWDMADNLTIFIRPANKESNSNTKAGGL